MTRYNACEDLLDRNLAEGRGDKLAFVDPSRSITYAELARDSRKFANVLKGLGVRREQRVALAMLDTVDWPVAFLGAIRGGVIPVCLNTLLSSEQYAYMLADSRAAVLLVSPALLPALRPALAQAPGLAHVIVVGPGAEGGELDFASLMADASDDFPTVDTHPDETAFWLYSSGSTGTPKGANHVHSSLIDTAKLFGQAVLGMREDDVVHSAAKLFFAYGLGNSLTFPMAAGATTILNPDRPTPAAVFDILEKRQPTIFCGVPTLFAAMLHDPAQGRIRLAAPAPVHLRRRGPARPHRHRLEKRFGSDIVDGVGSTEMLHIFLSNIPTTSSTARRASRFPAMTPGWPTKTASKSRTAMSANSTFAARPPPKATGTSARRAAPPSRANGPAPATNTRATRRPLHATAAAPTTCSRCPASGSRPSRSRARWSAIPRSWKPPSSPACRRGRAAQAQGLRRPEARRQRRRSRGFVEGSCEIDGRHVEIPALDRGARKPAQDRDRQDPAVQAADEA